MGGSSDIDDFDSLMDEIEDATVELNVVPSLSLPIQQQQPPPPPKPTSRPHSLTFATRRRSGSSSSSSSESGSESSESGSESSASSDDDDGTTAAKQPPTTTTTTTTHQTTTHQQPQPLEPILTRSVGSKRPAKAPRKTLPPPTSHEANSHFKALLSLETDLAKANDALREKDDQIRQLKHSISSSSSSPAAVPSAQDDTSASTIASLRSDAKRLQELVQSQKRELARQESQHASKISDLNQSLADLKTENKRLNDTIRKLELTVASNSKDTTSSSSAAKQLDALKSENRKLVEDSKKLMDTLEKEKRRRESAENAVKSETSKLDTMKQELSRSESALSKAESALSKAETARSRAEASLSKTESALAKAQASLKSLESASSRSIPANSSTVSEQDHQNLVDKYSSTKRELRASQEETRRLLEANQRLTIDLERLELRRTELDNDGLSSTGSSTSSSDEKKSMMGQILVLQRTVMKLEKEKLVLQDALTRHLVDSYDSRTSTASTHLHDDADDEVIIPPNTSTANTTTTSNDLPLTRPASYAASLGANAGPTPVSPQLTSSSNQSGKTTGPSKLATTTAPAPVPGSGSPALSNSSLQPTPQPRTTTTHPRPSNDAGVPAVAGGVAKLKRGVSGSGSTTSSRESSPGPARVEKGRPVVTPQVQQVAVKRKNSLGGSSTGSGVGVGVSGVGDAPALKKIKIVVSESSSNAGSGSGVKKGVGSSAAPSPSVSVASGVSAPVVSARQVVGGGRYSKQQQQAPAPVVTTGLPRSMEKSPVKASPRLEPIKASIPALSKPPATASQQQQQQSTKPNHNEPPRPLTPRALAAWVRTAQFTKSASSQIPPAVHTLTNSPKSFGAAKVDTLLKDVFLEVWRGTLLETQSPTKYDWPSVRLEFEDGEEEEELVCVPTKSTSWTLEHAMPREERAWVWFAWILANALPREEMNRFLGSVLGFIEDTVRSGSPGDVATVCRMTRFYTALVRLGTPSEYSRVHKIVESVVGVFSGIPRGVVEVLEGVEGCWPKAFRMRPRGSMETLTMEADVSMETWCGLVVYIRDGVLGKAEDVRNRCEWAENGIDPDWLHKPPPELIMELLSNLTNLLFFPPSDTTSTGLTAIADSLALTLLYFPSSDIPEFFYQLLVVPQHKAQVDMMLKFVKRFFKTCRYVAGGRGAEMRSAAVDCLWKYLLEEGGVGDGDEEEEGQVRRRKVDGNDAQWELACGVVEYLVKNRGDDGDVKGKLNRWGKMVEEVGRRVPAGLQTLSAR